MLTKKSGDLFANLPTDKRVIIPHVVNNCDQWGSGFVVPLMQKWPKTKEYYHSNKWGQVLGQVIYVPVEQNIFVANMCAQDNTTNKPRRLNYYALGYCMQQVAMMMGGIDEIISPAFGSGIGGGNPDFIDELIEDIWGNFSVTMYLLR